jgi:hypothetical protein
MDNVETVANPLLVRAPLLPLPTLLVSKTPQITRPSKIQGTLSLDDITDELPTSAMFFPYSRHFTGFQSVRLGKRQAAIEPHPTKGGTVRLGKPQAVEGPPAKKETAASEFSARLEQEHNHSPMTDDADRSAAAAVNKDLLSSHCVDPTEKRVVWSGKVAVNGTDICDAEITSCIPVDLKLWNMLVYRSDFLMKHLFFDVAVIFM